jgi:hypothetical protein
MINSPTRTKQWRVNRSPLFIFYFKTLANKKIQLSSMHYIKALEITRIKKNMFLYTSFKNTEIHSRFITDKFIFLIFFNHACFHLFYIFFILF